jgi:hypothetical protein
VRVRITAVAIAVVLFTAGAVGALGAWALGAAVVLLVAASVATVIVWEERDGSAGGPAPVQLPAQVGRGR